MASSIENYKMYIGGQWVDSTSGSTFESKNPYTGKTWAMIPDGNDQDVDKAVEAAKSAMKNPDWSKMPPMRRGHHQDSPPKAARWLGRATQLSGRGRSLRRLFRF